MMRVLDEAVLDEAAYPGASHWMEMVICCCVWVAKLGVVCVSWSVQGLLSSHSGTRDVTDDSQSKKAMRGFQPTGPQSGCSRIRL